MPKKTNPLKKKLLEEANEIASRLDFGCSIYEQRVYSEWNKLIEENRESQLQQSIDAEIVYSQHQISEHPRFKDVPLNPFNRVLDMAIEMKEKLKEVH